MYSIGELCDKLCIENLKIYNIREQLHQEGLSDEDYVLLNNKMNLLNTNRSILSNLLDEKVEAVVAGKEKNCVLTNVKTYNTQQTADEKWGNSIDVAVKEVGPEKPKLSQNRCFKETVFGLKEEKKEQNTYISRYNCSNCGYPNIFEIPVGKTRYDYLYGNKNSIICEYCGCEKRICHEIF